VLLVRHAGHALLLTGDLEGPGLGRVLGLPEAHVDVLMYKAKKWGSNFGPGREVGPYPPTRPAPACSRPSPATATGNPAAYPPRLPAPAAAYPRPVA
jgi:hypothetical protein